jgi:hypothetical protein
VKGQALGRRRPANVAGIVTPDTILRWYRLLVAAKYDHSKTRRQGRPSTKPDLAALVVGMAHQNPTWSYTRIRRGRDMRRVPRSPRANRTACGSPPGAVSPSAPTRMGAVSAATWSAATSRGAGPARPTTLEAAPPPVHTRLASARWRSGPLKLQKPFDDHRPRVHDKL